MCSVMVGHSNGGDISMYFVKRYPELINRQACT
jgi:pimeloyl-ACP methyl ester carboxylesterase